MQAASPISSADQPQPVHPLILFRATASALSGFLFGFDTVVISGADQTIQTICNLSPMVHGFVTASALYGTIVGSLCGGWPADRFGRRLSGSLRALEVAS